MLNCLLQCEYDLFLKRHSENEDSDQNATKVGGRAVLFFLTLNIVVTQIEIDRFTENILGLIMQNLHVFYPFSY